jgi:GTP pyrophosphokinase
MVKVKEGTPLRADGSIDVQLWLHHLASKGYFEDLDLIRSACKLSQLAGHDHATETGQSCLQQGLSMADILADMAVDQETLAASIIFESVHYAELSLEDVEEQLGGEIARLVRGVEKMSAIHHFQSSALYPHQKHQIDNVRKMLLAMVDDARVVLIKLAERLCVLRALAPMPPIMSHKIAQEVMEIYAPLANRLGIGAIKWEMEDLAFRYLHPKDYKEIAKGLKSKRLDRDRYVNMIVDELNQKIASLPIDHFAVYGRSKHIHSIHRKMTRKNVSLDEIYDATAVRILVDTTNHCYLVLGLVHELWEQVPAEFDDYIVNRKPNGYQSLHTAVTGPEGRVFEVQIRTFSMHEQAEMGVAAHWKYKEGTTHQKANHERKIEWLREVLAWHRDMATHKESSTSIEATYFDDRVYVFTPDGDVLDLPMGATTLDFAYHVHTEMGHRCRGTKVNGSIAPLTYVLQIGDRVEVLTGKEAKPSRDWINPHLNYLKTSRAKAKVLHWFNQQDFDKNVNEGRVLLDKELKNLGIKADRMDDVVQALKYKTLNDVLAALGRGDVKLSQILQRLLPTTPLEQSIKKLMKPPVKPDTSNHGLRIEGVGNLLTHMARCCQPLPGDEVIGYITLGRGVSVHRQDCPNILYSSDKQRERLLQVSWGNESRDHYMVDVLIKAYDRPHLLRDVTALLSCEKTHVFALNTQINTDENIQYITLTLEIDGLNSLSGMLSRLGQIPNVIEARRQI